MKPALDAKGGYFTARSESLSSQISNLSDKIDKKQEYVYTYQKRLTKQFNYMDQMIAQMNAQFSQMQQQLASIGVDVGS
ncbi:flagellar hook-associated protein 2:Flagellin hook IN [Clostridium sp. CAG:306]|nr:flagellar hook-associated protein 2:Flagellin hook IN [Clostridium sp. CAG:306]